MFHWQLGSDGLSITKSNPQDPVDFNTEVQGEEWIHAQLCALLLGNPVDAELSYELRRHGSKRRQWVLDQAKRELLNEQLRLDA